MQFGRLTHVGQVREVDVYVHWTVFLILALLLFARPSPTTFVGAFAYLSLLVIHEAGHVTVARMKGYQAFSIALYPVFGLASLERPDSRFDRAVIAWGGVAAQILVAIPVMAYVFMVGYTRFPAVNAVLVLWGAYSLCAVVFNLLPIPPLDGSVAWKIIPAYLERRRGL